MLTYLEAKKIIQEGGDEHGLSVEEILRRSMRLVANRAVLAETAMAAAEETLREFGWLRDPEEYRLRRDEYPGTR